MLPGRSTGWHPFSGIRPGSRITLSTADNGRAAAPANARDEARLCDLYGTMVLIRLFEE